MGRYRRIVIAALALAGWATPVSAQELVTVHGTVSWASLADGDTPFVPERAVVRGLFDEVPIAIGPSGTEGTYEGTALAGDFVILQVELQRCAQPGCAAPGMGDGGDDFLFYRPQTDIPTGVSDFVIDLAPPDGYALQSVSGSVAIGGGTIASGYTSFFTYVDGGLGNPPAALHYATVPLGVTDPTHASFAATVGVGQMIFQDVFVEYAECGPPPLSSPGPASYEVTADTPIVLPEFSVVNPIDCTQGPIILHVEPPASSVATVGASTRLTATVKNNTADYVYDARLHWDLVGNVRPRGWSTTNMSCSGTGFTPETGTSTLDCAFFSLAPGETVRADLFLGATGAGNLQVTATAYSFSAGPVSEGVALGAVAGSGADVQVFPPTLELDHGFQYWLNSVTVTAANAGPAVAQNVELRFSAAGMPISWFDLDVAAGYARYQDLGFVPGSEPETTCAVEAGTGDFVCVLASLDAWQEVTLTARFFTAATGVAALTLDATAAGDPNAANNSVTVPVLVVDTPLTDMSSTLTVLTPVPRLKEPFEIEWRVHNAGPGTGTGLGFWGGLGLQSYSIVRADGSPDCFTFINEVICYFNDLPPGGEAILHIVVKAPSGGDYLSYGEISPVYPAQYDPDYTNNRQDLTTDVKGRHAVISKEVVSLSGSVHIPCIPGDGFVNLIAKQRTVEKLRVRELGDGTVVGFLHTSIAARSESGTMVVFTEGGDTLNFELVSGKQRQVDHVFVRKNTSGEKLRTREQYSWIERLADGSDGMSVTWRIVLRYEQDEIGRWFEVLDRSDFECVR